MIPLITNEEYYTFTSTTSTAATDSLVSSMISAATLQIEQFCDCNFYKDTYIDWLNVRGCNYCYHNKQVIFPKAKPIIAVIYNGEIADGLTITNNNTTPYTFNVNDNKITVTNNLTYSAYDLSTTLNSIASTLTANYSISVVINSEVTNNGLLLQPMTLTVLPNETGILNGSKQIDINSIINGNTIRQYQTTGVISYVAGYDTIPLNLKMACACIVRDYYNIQTNKIKNYIKSESITNYSYTLSDNMNWYNIIESYRDQLGFYRDIVF